MDNRLKIAVLLILLANVLKKSPIYLLLYFLAFAFIWWGCWRSIPKLTGTAMLVGFASEIIGTHFCIPFGCYEYVNLKPQFLGVALFVPFAWGIFSVISYMTAAFILKRGWRRILLASLLMCILDLSVDPIMTSWDAWVWKITTAVNWFGIPWTNYVGWFLVSLIIFYLYERSSHTDLNHSIARLGPPIYLLEMFTFALYAPRSVKTPTLLAFLTSLIVLVLLTVWRLENEGRPDTDAR